MKMRMAEMTVDIPEDVLFALNQSKGEFICTMKLLTAVELFRDHRLSLGKASSLAGMAISDFLLRLASFGVSAVDYDPEDFAEELASIGSMC
jgi:predicted HTH domain antitoxin